MTIALRESIEEILSASSEPMDLDRIGYELASDGDIYSTGVAPLKSIYLYLENAIRAEGDSCPFLKTYTGVYMLKKKAKAAHFIQASRASSTGQKDALDQIGIISCYGLFWRRDMINWTPTPEIVGSQFLGSKQVNFCGQRGVYALHWDNMDVEFIGHTGDRSIGTCLHEHTQDRLKTRWQRFSFFGFRPVTDDGTLERLPDDFKVADIMSAMGAIIVELYRPRANKKYFDLFSALVFVQTEDPGIKDAL